MSRYKEVDIEKARELRQEGWTYQMIGDYFGVSTENARIKILGITKTKPKLTNKVLIEDTPSLAETIKAPKPEKPQFITLKKTAEIFQTEDYKIIVKHDLQVIRLEASREKLPSISQLDFDDAKTLFTTLGSTLNYINQFTKE